MTTSPVLEPTELATLDERDFYRHLGEINTAYAEAATVYQTASDNLTVLLTEQITRHLRGLHPGAAMLFVRVAAEYHHTVKGARDRHCEGHNQRLVPFEVVDGDGIVLGGFDPYSPVVYLMERLTPFLGMEDHVLDLDTREWALDCTSV